MHRRSQRIVDQIKHTSRKIKNDRFSKATNTSKLLIPNH
jgi:hypothetical protein